jgi:hypothetical protein
MRTSDDAIFDVRVSYWMSKGCSVEEAMMIVGQYNGYTKRVQMPEVVE